MMIENAQSGQYQKLTQELRRGILVLAALSQLKEEKYGYSLISSLAEKGLDIEQGTLYPLLRRLEDQGLLIDWAAGLQGASKPLTEGFVELRHY